MIYQSRLTFLTLFLLFLFLKCFKKVFCNIFCENFFQIFLTYMVYKKAVFCHTTMTANFVSNSIFINKGGLIMGRELRRVPANWEHPRDENGSYIPMHEHFPYSEEEITERIRDGWLENSSPDYGCAIMPQWSETDRTHYQMYESTSEGTPISPVMETAESLAYWLAENNVAVFANIEVSYEEWLSIIKENREAYLLLREKTH